MGNCLFATAINISIFQVLPSHAWVIKQSFNLYEVFFFSHMHFLKDGLISDSQPSLSFHSRGRTRAFRPINSRLKEQLNCVQLSIHSSVLLGYSPCVLRRWSTKSHSAYTYIVEHSYAGRINFHEHEDIFFFPCLAPQKDMK